MAEIKIQYVSDIHLEHRSKFSKIVVPQPRVKFLALCGNIGNFQNTSLLRSFLSYVSSNWEHTWYVPGNHELYSFKTPASTIIAQLRQLCTEWPNVHFLHRDFVDVPDTSLRVVGTTWWSHVPYENSFVQNLIGDYQSIKLNDKSTLTTTVSNEWHRLDHAWFQKTIEDSVNTQKTVLVLTHHLPSFRMIADKYSGLVVNCCFASHDDEFITKSKNIAAWICGHSYVAKVEEFKTEDGKIVTCALNACGYPHEHVYGFSTGAVITV